jgi:hypothetical protein
MAFVGVALIGGVRNEKIGYYRERCVKMADEIAMRVDPDTREVISNTLSAGLCVIAKAHQLLGDEHVAIDLHSYSLKHDLTPDGRKRWEELLEETASRVTIFSVQFGGRSDQK